MDKSIGISEKRQQNNADTPSAPWQAVSAASGIPMHLEYPDGSMFDAVKRTAQKYPDNKAIIYEDRCITYKELTETIRKCAAVLSDSGIKSGDAVTIAMQSCPEAVILLYAVNLAGGICNMVNPLAPEKEMSFFLNEAKSSMLVTPTLAEKIISRSNRFPESSGVRRNSEDPAVILYSGGTTGNVKGIVLTNGNFNALGMQVIAANPMFETGDRMLSVLPLFHGFGLGVCVHTALANGACCVLQHKFIPKAFAKLITKYRCSFVAGVPTLFEALTRLTDLDDEDFSSLKGVFSGGDSLPAELREKTDAFLKMHGSKTGVREGYGTTECVTASCLMPPGIQKDGCLGIPFPDTYYRIADPETGTILSYDEEGEILISGPTVMKGYLNRKAETEAVLTRDENGICWLHTGDLGSIDEDGFIRFCGRIKRVIISSGYNVYPEQLERIINEHPLVMESCVIGVKDRYRMQAVKAFVMLMPGVKADDSLKEEIKTYCALNVAKNAVPEYIEFRKELPRTPVGKVAYKLLEEEEN